MRLVPFIHPSVHLSVCPSVHHLSHTLTFPPTTLSFGIYINLDLGQVGIVGQRSRSNAKSRFLTSLSHCFKVKVKGWDQGQRLGSRSRTKVKFKFLPCSSQYQGLAFTGCSKEQQPPLPVQSDCLCVCNQWAYADNCADAVIDRLLIFICYQMEEGRHQYYDHNFHK